jgi:hypothetical protein
MGADTQVIDGILKDYYEDFVSEQLNQRNPLKDLFKFEEVPFAGREIVYSAHVARNVSPMFVGEDGAFADAGAQQHVQIRVGQKKMMARIRMTSESIADSLKSEGAFKQSKKDEMDGLIKDIARREEAALCLDGRGVLANVSSVSGTTINVKDPGGITNASFGNRFLIKGMWLARGQPGHGRAPRWRGAGDGRRVQRRVVHVRPCQLRARCVDGQRQHRAGREQRRRPMRSTRAYEHAYWGLMALVDDGTYRNNYFGADRSQVWAVLGVREGFDRRALARPASAGE